MGKYIFSLLALAGFGSVSFAAAPMAPPDLKEAHVTLPYPELKRFGRRGSERLRKSGNRRSKPRFYPRVINSF
jgi:hypothetical protein